MNFVQPTDYEATLTRKPRAWEVNSKPKGLTATYYNQPVNVDHITAFEPVQQAYVFRDSTGLNDGAVQFPAIRFLTTSGELFWFFSNNDSRDNAIERLLNLVFNTGAAT
jgi:hypothetical protein